MYIIIPTLSTGQEVMKLDLRLMWFSSWKTSFFHYNHCMKECYPESILKCIKVSFFLILLSYLSLLENHKHEPTSISNIHKNIDLNFFVWYLLKEAVFVASDRRGDRWHLQPESSIWRKNWKLIFHLFFLSKRKYCIILLLQEPYWFSSDDVIVQIEHLTDQTWSDLSRVKNF